MIYFLLKKVINLKVKIVEDYNKWEILKAAIIENEFVLWQWQHSAEHSEGFHAWFTKDGKDFEIITHNPKIEESMFLSELYKVKGKQA